MTSTLDDRRYLIPFRSSLLPHIFTDVLVIGSGVAGMRAALAAADDSGDAGPCEVILLAKDGTELSSTAWAQGGIAAVMDAPDDPALHVEDTLTAGAGLCDRPVVERIVGGARDRIRELLDWGMRFDRDGAGTLVTGREGGHGRGRILHANGDATGRELARCLAERVAGTPGIRVFTKCFALDLLTPSDAPDGAAPVMGAVTHHPRYGLQIIWARTTILATGGAGVVYRETSNPRTATGDGIAMAWRAGAPVADMAFIQFHPTTLYLAGASRALITEAVRGEGGLLLDHAGYRFMPDAHPLAELAPRDVVTRAIIRRLATHGGTNVFLDARAIPAFDRRFPGIAELLARFDLDPARDLVPVHPAAHYTIGGVAADAVGRTALPGLFAVGETACSGLHGANRLASNSLLEGLVMGEIAGREARRTIASWRSGSPGARDLPGPWALAPRPAPVPLVSDIRLSEQAELDLVDVESSLRSAMWRNVGIERAGGKLADAGEMIEFWARYTLDKIFDTPQGWQIQNMLQCASLITRSALWRAESRGCHWRTDAPAPDETLARHDCWQRGAGSPVLSRTLADRAWSARA